MKTANHLPESTYRVQLHKGFGFRDAAAVVPYLAELGVTHVYCSPYLAARPGSTHGYDVIDHCRLNPELGTGEDFEAFLGALRAHGMGHILDMVPNHVGIGAENVWWNEMLEKGPGSKYGRYFDIAWESSPRTELKGKVLLPVLGDHYGKVLERGELKVVREEGKAYVRYHSHRWPISAESLAGVGDVEELNRSADRLDEVLSKQFYRLSYWRTASDEINYRRFFDCNDLAALAMERQEVFDATHGFVMGMVERGEIAGLRIDHPDGLYDPAQYLRRLQERVPGTYVTVEKILAVGEELPDEWPVHGTSGYDFLNEVNALFVDRTGEGAMTEVYQAFTGDRTAFEDLVYEKKKLVMEMLLASELHTLAHQLDRIAQRDRRSRDFTFLALHQGLREMIACFPVYRTYVADEGAVSEVDRKHVDVAVNEAVERNPRMDAGVFEFIRETMFGEGHERRRFAGKFQQVTAPVTAKGIEDTAFYCYHRLVSLNEVGGDPARFGSSPAELHRYLEKRQETWPYALSALSTHDTKRSEDVRARINVLSEVPRQWRERVMRWREINAKHKQDGAPAADEEYLLYQTLVGAWIEGGVTDEFVSRIQAYLRKAMREAKLRTLWTAPNEKHESAVAGFVKAILRDGEFLAEFEPFQQRVAAWGDVNTLAQTLVRLTAPGVPDTYQGTEMVDLSLVDPDNRRAVDYEARRRALADVKRDRKMLVTATALRARRERPGLFTVGEYVPLEASERAFGFMRRHGGKAAVTVVPRLVAVGDKGGTVTIPSDVRWRHALTGKGVGGGRVELARLFEAFPVALLLSEDQAFPGLEAGAIAVFGGEEEG